MVQENKEFVCSYGWYLGTGCSYDNPLGLPPSILGFIVIRDRVIEQIHWLICLWEAEVMLFLSEEESWFMRTKVHMERMQSELIR